MEKYVEESLKYIESEEMRRFLRNCLHSEHCQTDWQWRIPYTCGQIVTYAPAPIGKKILTLDLISAQASRNSNQDLENIEKLASEHRIALDERYNTSSGEFYYLQDWFYHEECGMLLNSFFSSFDAAIRYIHDLPKEEYELDTASFLSYSIEKYVPDEGGIYQKYCTWILNDSAHIWYFDYGEKYKPRDWENIFAYRGWALNLPVPFHPGDIILADCRPFSKERRVVILEIGDNHDCCAVQCLYMCTALKLGSSAFKHNSFHSSRENSPVSVLYRAVKWNTELPEGEEPLAIISTAIKHQPSLGCAINEWVHSNRTKDRNDDNNEVGATWEKMKEAFGL
ncbi:hypothetical protein LJC61_08300 [Ruminococcaceae bacterium OttesenSCG-928-A16]|nr:hypothetical protein [Ruminococcaceae bacterium OttesenSCG-928-A16]